MVDPTSAINTGSITSHLFDGGMTSVAAFAILVIGYLIYDRKLTQDKITNLEDTISKQNDEYYNSTILLSEAFNALNITLNELKSKL